MPLQQLSIVQRKSKAMMCNTTSADNKRGYHLKHFAADFRFVTNIGEIKIIITMKNMSKLITER